MNYVADFLALLAIHVVGVASPGPDFFLVIKNTLAHDKKTGIFTALGIGLGILVHVFYSLVGIGLIISQSVVLFSVVKYAGAAYLIYLGIKAMRTKKQVSSYENKEVKKMSPAKAMRMGFFTNCLNPKATLFFIAIFSVVIDQRTPEVLQAGYGLVLALVAFLEFSLFATILSHKKVMKLFSKAQYKIERAFGALITVIGAKIALE